MQGSCLKSFTSWTYRLIYIDHRLADWFVGTKIPKSNVFVNLNDLLIAALLVWFHRDPFRPVLELQISRGCVTSLDWIANPR